MIGVMPKGTLWHVYSACACSVDMAYGPLHATPITLGVPMTALTVFLENWLLHQVALLCSYHILVTQRTKNKSSAVGRVLPVSKFRAPDKKGE